MISWVGVQLRIIRLDITHTEYLVHNVHGAGQEIQAGQPVSNCV